MAKEERQWSVCWLTCDKVCQYLKITMEMINNNIVCSIGLFFLRRCGIWGAPTCFLFDFSTCGSFSIRLSRANDVCATPLSVRRFQYLHIQRGHHLCTVPGRSPQLCVVLSGGKNTDRSIHTVSSCPSCQAPGATSLNRNRAHLQHSSSCEPVRAVLSRRHGTLAFRALHLWQYDDCETLSQSSGFVVWTSCCLNNNEIWSYSRLCTLF